MRLSFPISILVILLGVVMLCRGLGDSSLTFLGHLIHLLIGIAAMYLGFTGGDPKETEENIKGGAR